MRYNILAFLVILYCLSCKERVNYVLKVPVKKLKSDEIYDIYAVEEVIFTAQEQNTDSIRNISRKRFLEGVDLLRNKRQVYKAIEKFKSSVLIFPDAKTYYELADALFMGGTKKSLEESLEAYEVAEELGFQPGFMVSYNKAKVQYRMAALEGDKTQRYYLVQSADYDLKNAFVNGFRDTMLIKNSYLFGGQLGPEKLFLFTQNYVNRANAGMNAMFNAFVMSFGETHEDHTITNETAGNTENLRVISYDFKEFIPEMENTGFGRDVSHDYFFVSKVRETTNYIAVIYGTVSFWEEEEVQPVMYTLAVFDLQGRRISSLPFACSCSAEKVKSGKIAGDKIIVEDFKREWASPLTKVPVSENKVTAYTSLAKAEFRIREDGVIEAESVPDGYSDSVKFATAREGSHHE